MKFVGKELMASQISGKPPGAYRVLHTADWHLGKMLGEHSREHEHRRFLDFLLAAVGAHSIDVVLIAGDVFDSPNPPQSAVAQYYDFLSALFRQGGCSVVIVAGNHDSPAHLEAPRQILKAPPACRHSPAGSRTCPCRRRTRRFENDFSGVAQPARRVATEI